MSSLDRPDDFEIRREHLRSMTDDELHAHFWQLVDKIVQPLVEEARTHTTPAIERSVLLRMGFSGDEARRLVELMGGRAILGHGAGRIVFELAKTKGMTVREAGRALLEDRYWEELIV